MGRRLGWTCLAALILAPAVLSAQDAVPRLARSVPAPPKIGIPADDTLYVWRKALHEFQAVGPLVAAEQFDQAAARMAVLVRMLPPPYCTWASWKHDRFVEFHRKQVANRRRERGFSYYFPMAVTCHELTARSEAVELLRKALQAKPKNGDEWTQLLRSLRDFRLNEAELVEFEQLMESESAKATCRELVTTLRRQRPQGAGSWDFAASEMQRLVILDALHKTLTPLMPDAERREVYESTIAALSFSDAERDAWEAKLLVDLKHDSDACARVYYERGSDAKHEKQVAVAMVNFQKVCDVYPKSSFYRQAKLELGDLFLEQKQIDEAIKSYLQLMLTDEEYQARIQQTQHLRWYVEHQAARGLSRCYEIKNDFARALEWFDVAETRYPHSHWCGTCQESIKVSTAERRAYLQAKTGQLAAAINTLDDLMFQGTGVSGFLPQDDAVRLYVDLHQRLGELVSLELKLRVNKEKNLRDHAEKMQRYPKQSHDQSFDGNTSSMKTALACLAELKVKAQPAPAMRPAPAPQVDAAPSILDLDKRSKRK